MKTVKAYSGADLKSDHNQLMEEVRLRLNKRVNKDTLDVCNT